MKKYLNIDLDFGIRISFGIWILAFGLIGPAYSGPITITSPSANPATVNTSSITIQGTSLDPVMANGVLCSNSSGSFSCPITLTEGSNLITLTDILPSSLYGVCAVSRIDLSYNGSIQTLSGGSGLTVAALSDVSVQEDAEIHGNAKVGGNYSGKNNAKIYGDLRIHGTATLINNAAVSGNVIQLSQVPDPCNGDYNLDQALNQVQTHNDNSLLLSDPSISPYIQNGSFRDYGDDNLTFPAGTFYFESFSIGNNVHLSLATGARVRIFVRGDVVLENNSKVNGDGAAQNQLYLVSGADNTQGKVFNIKNNAFLGAVVYAPRAEVSVSSKGSLSGNLVCRNYTGANNSTLISYPEWQEAPDTVVLTVIYNPE